MLQWLYTYVARVCSKCFIYLRRMLQVFYLDVAYVAMAMLQMYVSNISSVLDVCCNLFPLSVAKNRSGGRVVERGRES